MLIIRLSRIGRKGEARYRIVVKEKRSKRDGAAVDTIGFYEKMVNGENKKIDMDRFNHWISKGAQPTPTVKRIVEAKN